jgi:ABC-type xylose transport system permease subunit
VKTIDASRPSAIDILGARSLRMVLVLLALWLVLAIHPATREAFLTAGNFSNLTAQVAEIVIIGVGMTLVICIRGIDLSVGALMAMTGVVAAKLQIDYHQGAIVSIAVALLIGALVGLWHGVLVSRFQVPPFIATLGGFLAYRGIGLVLSDARGLSPMNETFSKLGARIPSAPSAAICVVGLVAGSFLVLLAERRRRALGLGAAQPAIIALRLFAVVASAAFFAVIYQDGMPVPVLVAALATAIGALILARTRLGRYAFALGGNAEAARLSGVPVGRVTVLIYLLTGLLTALAGMVAAARTNGVTPGNMGLMRELHVITAVVIGGTSLSGGRATVVGTVIGALIFGTLSNGMNLMNVNSNWQLILTGAILLGASLLDSTSNRGARSTGGRA